MKKWLLFIFVVLGVFRGFAEPLPADDILKFVRSKLPTDPIKLSGDLQLIAKNKHKTSYPVVMELNWGATPPEATYNIGKETMTIIWNNERPTYRFSNSKNTPTADILGSGMTWADLSFSVLWWPNSKLIDEGKKLDRACYIVDVPIPNSDNTMRLWIEKKMGMLMESRTIDKKGQSLRRLKIKSLKKMSGMWVAKDLELTNYKTGKKTTLRISSLDWEEPKPTPVAMFDSADAVNQLAFDLYTTLSTEQEGNLFLSPYSISSALAMTYGGTRGETETQMADVFHFGGQGATHPAFSTLRKKLNRIQNNGNVQLSVANSLWPQVDYAFLSDYLAMTKEFYGSEIQPVNYKSDTARLKINNWVESKTNNRIKDLIPAGTLDPLTRLVLANAIYFKGNWASQFKKEATRPAPFKLADGTTTNAPMMSQEGDFKLARSKEFQALELPYEGNNLSMIILLPNDPDKLPVLGNEILATLEFNETDVFVQLPKFKIESSFGLSDTLATMGMPLAFNPDKADFSGMDGTKNLYIGAILHKAFIEVNEEGTEAAAATAVVMKARSIPPQFIANRPFLFLIRENASSTILFIGRVLNPNA